MRHYGNRARTAEARVAAFATWLIMARDVTRERALEEALRAGLRHHEAMEMIEAEMARRAHRG
jgi:signal transduction protein with GAF and PtsI domain